MDCSQTLQAEVRRTAEPGLLLKTVHKIYQGQFWRWFRIMVPTSIMAGLILTLSEQRVKALFRSIPRGAIGQHYFDILVADAIRFAGFFLSWVLGCFALAAIATVVSGLDDHDQQTVWVKDSYQRAREHVRPLILTAFIIFSAFILCGAVFGLLEFAALEALFERPLYRHTFAAGMIGYVFVASGISWLGASIPLVVRGDLTVWAGLKKSMKLSRGYQGALFLLVVESVVGSYIAWYAVVNGLPLLVPHAWQYPVWYIWIVRLLGVLASASVEPPLFIGFALLADPEQFNLGNSADVGQIRHKVLPFS